MAIDLGQIKKVSIRDVWKHEEKEFTPWLAMEANISKLADELGLELQVEGVEVPVGPFSADVLAKDASGDLVIIENQFGKTDHDHLGKVLTYAATLGATAVIWIAERFTEIWNPNPNKLDKIILLDRNADLDDHSKWEEYISWLVDKVAKFRKAFGPRVLKLKFLDSSAGEPPEAQT